MTADELLIMRRKVPMSQAALAKALGCSRQTIINWERAVHTIPAKMFGPIAQACTNHIPKLPGLTATDKAALAQYTKMRDQPGEIGTHAFIMAFWKENNFTPSQAALDAIASHFPDAAS